MAFSKISHLFFIHLSFIVMLHHNYKLAWSADYVHFALTGQAKEVLSNRVFSPLCSGREWCQLGTRRRICKLLRGRQGRSSFNQGYKEIIKRWDLETHCCEVCTLKQRTQRNHDSKVQTWTPMRLHQCLSLDQEPTSKASLPVLPTLCASFWLGEWIWKRWTQSLSDETHTWKHAPGTQLVHCMYKHLFSPCHDSGCTSFPWDGCWGAWILGWEQ